MIAGPVFVEPDIRNANKSPNKRLDGRARTARVQVEIDRLLPHRNQEHSVAGPNPGFLNSLAPQPPGPFLPSPKKERGGGRPGVTRLGERAVLTRDIAGP